MTALTSNPQSGLYFQKGSIVQLVVQMVDSNTGLPVPLQSASALFIDILYPDEAGWRTFVAQLYTDGSDGMISYTTINDGLGYSDLNQVGLYMLQARATIGVPLPPSLETDFYVLPNVSDQAMAAAPDPVLIANDGTFWQVHILSGGQQQTVLVTDGSKAVSSFYLTDSSGQVWIVTAVRTPPADAHLNTAKVSGQVPTNQQIYQVDSQRHQWVVTVLTTGNLRTT